MNRNKKVFLVFLEIFQLVCLKTARVAEAGPTVYNSLRPLLTKWSKSGEKALFTFGCQRFTRLSLLWWEFFFWRKEAGSYRDGRVCLSDAVMLWCCGAVVLCSERETHGLQRNSSFTRWIFYDAWLRSIATRFFRVALLLSSCFLFPRSHLLNFLQDLGYV